MKRLLQWRVHQCPVPGRGAQLRGAVVPCRAVEGDDWSSVIDGQTAETLVQGVNPAEESSQHPIATPFARASVHRSIGEPLNIITIVILSSTTSLLRWRQRQGGRCSECGTREPTNTAFDTVSASRRSAVRPGGVAQ